MGKQGSFLWIKYKYGVISSERTKGIEYLFDGMIAEGTKLPLMNAMTYRGNNSRPIKWKEIRLVVDTITVIKSFF